jgi:hypothetical protein
MKKLKIAVSTAAVFIAVFVASGFLHLQGVCISEARVLPDEEKLNKMIEDIYNRSVVEVEIMKPGKSGKPRPYREAYQQVPYESVDEFLKQNPDCCEFGNYEKWGNLPSSSSTWFSKFMGVYAGEVDVIYNARYIDEDGNEQHTTAKTYRTIQNCGVVP